MSRLDVLLVNPATELPSRGAWNREPPLGLLYIAAMLEAGGFECQVIELHPEETDMTPVLDRIPVPRVVGFTSLTNNASKALDLAKQARSFYKQRGAQETPLFAMGGPHATFAHRHVLDQGVIDVVVNGEAELGFESLVNAKEKHVDITRLKHAIGSGACPALSISFLNPQQTSDVLTHGATDNVPRDLDSVPFPARHLLPINRQSHKYQTATVIVNRGCPNQCIFCSRQALFKKARWRSPANIIDEIAGIHSIGTYEYYNIYDNLTVSLPFMDKLLRVMESDARLFLPWGAELRADMVNEDRARALKKAGCNGIATGIESASPRVLALAGKIQSPGDVTAGLRHLKDRGIPVQAYFVIGLPGETTGTFRETMRFIERSPLQAGTDKIDFFAATPYPGSALQERAGDLGVDIFDKEFDHYDCQHLVCKPSTLSMDELEAIWTEAKAFEARFNKHLA